MTDLQQRFFHDFIQPAADTQYYIGALSSNSDTLSGRIDQVWAKAGDIDGWLERLDPVLSSLPHSVNYTPVLRSSPNSKDNTVAYGVAFWVDIDNYLWSDWEKNQLSIITGSVLEPSVYIDSGWGVHLYWFLNQGVDLTDPAVRKIYEETAAMLSWAFNADVQSSSPSHLIRLPGSYNCKSSPYYKEVKIMYSDRDRVDINKLYGDAKACLYGAYNKYIADNKPGDKKRRQFIDHAKRLIDKIEGKLPEGNNKSRSENTFSNEKFQTEVPVLINELHEATHDCPLLDMAVNHPGSIGFSEWMSVGCGLAKIFEDNLAEEVFYEISLPGNSTPNPESNIKGQFRKWAVRGLMPCNCTNVNRMSIDCPKARAGTCKSILSVLSRIARQRKTN